MKIKRFKGDWLLYIIVGTIISVFCILALTNVAGLRDSIEEMVLIIMGVLLLIYLFFTGYPKIVIQKETTELTILKVIEVIVLFIIAIMALGANSMGIEGSFPSALCIALPITTYAFIDVIRGYDHEGSRTKNEEIMKYVSVFLLIVGIVLVTISAAITAEITTLFLSILLIIGLIFLIVGIVFKILMPKVKKVSNNAPKKQVKTNKA